MSAPTVRRRDITLEEQVEHEIGFAQIEGRSHYWWEATLSGSLSTGEYVSINRSGDTFAEALANLEAAIAENGWVIE